jgi:hypothetical protein
MHPDMIKYRPPNQLLSALTTETPTPSQFGSPVASWELTVAEKGKIVAIMPACNAELFISNIVLKARTSAGVGSEVVALLEL